MWLVGVGAMALRWAGQRGRCPAVSPGRCGAGALDARTLGVGVADGPRCRSEAAAASTDGSNGPGLASRRGGWAPGEEVGELGLEDAEFVAPGVAHDPEVVVALLLVIPSG